MTAACINTINYIKMAIQMIGGGGILASVMKKKQAVYWITCQSWWLWTRGRIISKSLTGTYGKVVTVINRGIFCII